MEDVLFWADSKARKITERKKFHYIDREIPEFDKLTIKTSASISGVLHIGRLSDTIRADSVCIALQEAGYDAELIWVAEDMDPLRKIPEGVPRKFEEYIGMPVTSVPDPWGCHSSYAEHHVSSYFKVIQKFVRTDIKGYSMRDEYTSGNFKPYIKEILENRNRVIEILNRYRQKPIPQGYSPFVPICENCGKIITTRVDKYEEGKVYYSCQDYKFEKYTAKGCGHIGIADPLKDLGKLMWKSEWAAQWAHWKIVSEGAGKEYVVPMSAWWVNGEITEKIFGFPMPVPIFYEHLMINGEKMSASLGNVVYPKDWLEVAPAQLLRFFYNKKLMKTRSFSWQELPRLYDDYDNHARVYSGLEKVGSEKELKHMRRLYEISQLDTLEKPNPLPFSHAAMVASVYKEKDDIISSLKKSGHYREEMEEHILRRVEYARVWFEKYAPEIKSFLIDDVNEIRGKLSEEQIRFLGKLGEVVSSSDLSGEELQQKIYEIAQELGVPLKAAFQSIYLVTLGKAYGPKAGMFLASLPRKWVVKRLEDAAS